MQHRHTTLVAIVAAALLAATCGSDPHPWGAEAEAWVDAWFLARSEGIANELTFYDEHVVWEDRTGGHLFDDRESFVDYAAYVLGEIDPSVHLQTFLTAEGMIERFWWPSWTPPVERLSRVRIGANGIVHVVDTGSTVAGRVYRPEWFDYDEIDDVAWQWLDIWNGDGRLDDLYDPDAEIIDSLADRSLRGAGAFEQARTAGTWPDLPPVTIERLTDDTGPLITMGPALRPGDLHEIGFVVRIDDPVCPRSLAVFLGWDGDRVVWERRAHELRAARACESTETFVDGWWVGREPPDPISRVFTGVAREPTTGWEVSLYNASGALERVVVRMLDRFVDAGIGVPEVDDVAFLEYRSVCASWDGFATSGPRGSVVNICLEQSQICDDPECARLDPHAELMILHEFAHVWLFDHADEALRREFTAFVGLTDWNDPDDDWSDRAMERAASAIAVGVAQLGDAPCDDGRYCDVAPGSFELLTGVEPTGP